MSTQPPLGGAERRAARSGRTPSDRAQLLVVLMGAVAALVIAAAVVELTTGGSLFWALAAIPAGTVAFVGLLGTAGWSMRAALGQIAPTHVTAGRYLVVALLTATATVLVLRGADPVAAWLAPLATAAVVAALATTARRRRHARARYVEVLRTGTRTVGTVTDDGLAEFPVSPNTKLATLTVSFLDEHRTERWVTVPATQVPGAAIEVGQRVDVWYDAADPSAEDRILVEHDNGTSRVLPRPR